MKNQQKFKKAHNFDDFKQFLSENGITNPWQYVADLAKKSGHFYDTNQIYATREDLPILEEYNKKAKDEYKFHLDILPCPFVGDVFNAKIIVLTLNPGFIETINYERYTKLTVEEQKQVTDFHIENLEFRAKSLFPNKAVSLMQDEYWEKRTKELRERYGLQDSDFAVIQHIGYQSNKANISQDLKHLKSIDFTKLLIEFIVKSRTDDYVFVIARKKDIWQPLLEKFYSKEQYEKHVVGLNSYLNPYISQKNFGDYFHIVERAINSH